MCNNPGFLQGIDRTPSRPPLHVKASFRSVTLQQPLKTISSSKLAPLHNSVFIKQLSRLAQRLYEVWRCGTNPSGHRGRCSASQRLLGKRQEQIKVSSQTGVQPLSLEKCDLDHVNCSIQYTKDNKAVFASLPCPFGLGVNQKSFLLLWLWPTT